MSLVEPLQVISSVLSEPGKLALPAPGGRWQLLFHGGQHPLLVPTVDYELQKRWLPYFIGGRLRQFYAGVLLRLNAWLPAAHLLPEIEILRVAAKFAPGAAAGAPAAIQIGTSGPYRKASALLISGQRKELALAKFALAPGADPMIEAEAAWLKDLEGIAGFSDEVPRLLDEGTVANGRRFLVTSLAPSTGVTTRFTPAHAEFLVRLGRARMQVVPFEASPCFVAMDRALAELGPFISREEAATLRDALDYCRGALAGFTGPFVLSQGDFAWWNIRIRPGGIFVFDWEYARAGANPLADFFHFHLIRCAASGRRVGRWYLSSVLRQGHTFAKQCHPDSGWRASDIAALALSYLLDVLLHYARAGGGIDHEERVTGSYWDLVVRRSAWLAA